MTCFDMIEAAHRNGFKEQGDLAASSAADPKSNPMEYKRLRNVIANKINDQALDMTVDQILQNIIDDPFYARSFAKPPTKMNRTETMVIQYCAERGVRLEHRRNKNNERLFITPSGVLSIVAPGQVTPSDGLDWDLYYGGKNLISHKYYRVPGGHQSHQIQDLMRRMRAAEEYLRLHPNTDFRFFGVVDCPHSATVLAKQRKHLDPAIINTGKVVLCDTDTLVNILMRG